MPQRHSDIKYGSFGNVPQQNFGIKKDDASDIVQQQIAGELGERIFNDALKSILRSDDILLSNISITYNEQKTELDSIIINSFGIFVIEVKNYSGIMHGNINDFEWTKITCTDSIQHTKSVKNPVKQVKREIHILKDYPYK